MSDRADLEGANPRDQSSNGTDRSPMLEIVAGWSVDEQISMAQESDERAAIAREQNHIVYSDLRRLAFESRKMARNNRQDSTETER